MHVLAVLQESSMLERARKSFRDYESEETGNFC